MLRRANALACIRSCTMAMLTLSEAASATGVNRSTLFRAYKSGRMSATRTDAGAIEVDPSELFRVFKPVAAEPLQTAAAPQLATPPDAQDNPLHANALEVEIKLLREMLESMRNDRDAWREQAAKITAALPPPNPVAPKRRPWWRLAG
jgi:hypothetical protein